MTPARFNPDFENATYRKVAWRLMPFLFLLYILAYLDRVNVGFAKLQMSADLAFSEAAYGVGAGIFFLGYFFLEVPSNMILQKVGARRWIARIMIMWGIISAGMMFTNSATTFYLLRFFLGAAEAGFFPGIILYLTYWFTRTHRVRMIAGFMTAIAFAGIIGGPVSGWILSHMAGVGGLRGWQWLYLLEGVPSVIVGIAVLFYLDDGPATSKWLAPAEKALLSQRLADEEEMKQAQGDVNHSAAAAFTNPRVWLLALVYFGIIMGLYGISFWLPQIIKDTLSTDPVNIGLISAIPWTVAAAAMIVNGMHSDRTGERRWHLVLACIICSLAFAVSGMPGIGGWAGVAALTVATAGVMSAMSCFWSLPTAILSGTAAAAGIALINSVGNLAGYVSPFVVGRIRDATHSMTLALGVLSLSVMVAAILALYVAAPTRMTASTQVK